MLNTVKGLFIFVMVLVLALAGCSDGSKSNEAKITALTLTLDGSEYSATDFDSTTVTVTVPPGTTIPDSATVVSVTLSSGASGLAVNTVLPLQDDSATVTLTAEDGVTTAEYTIYFRVAVKAEIKALTLTLDGSEYSATDFDSTTVTVTVPPGTTIPDSVTVVSVTLSSGASGLAVNTVLPLQDGSATVTLTAEDGVTTAEYTIAVTATILQLSVYSLSYPVALKTDDTVTASPVFWKGGREVSIPTGVSYAVASSLPVGLALDSVTGTISGTMPSLDFVTAYTITATGDGSVVEGSTTATFLDKFLWETEYTQDTTGTPISDRAGLEAIGNNADGKYYLTDHIDLGTDQWIPLCSDNNNPFAGTLHGNGYTVYNLNIGNSNGISHGLFARVSGATIENLGIGVTDITVSAGDVGALAGIASNNPLIRNIAIAPMTAEAKIENTPEEVPPSIGGIVAYLLSGTLEGYNLGLTVSGVSTFSEIRTVGGLVGSNYGTVSGYATGAVSGTEKVGGLVGSNYGTVSGHATGDVSGTRLVGGLVGSNDGTVVSAYATGRVSATSDYVGGLVGSNYGTVSGYATGHGQCY